MLSKFIDISYISSTLIIRAPDSFSCDCKYVEYLVQEARQTAHALTAITFIEQSFNQPQETLIL